ncbi:MAG: calcium-binding protein [Microvirga sp.]
MANVQFHESMLSGTRLKDLFVAPTSVPVATSAEANFEETLFSSLSVSVRYGGSDITLTNGGKVTGLLFASSNNPWLTYAGSPQGFSYGGSLAEFHATGVFAAGIAMAGSDSITGSANGDYMDGYAGNDTLDGGAGEDTMEGGSGDDLYYVNISTDRVFDYVNQGNDTIIASSDYALAAGSQIERLEAAPGSYVPSLTGNAFGSFIIGNEGANVLNDGGGVSTLQGGAGNDTYIVQSAGTLIVEPTGSGGDIVLTSVSYALSDANDIASISAMGIDAIALSGNNRSNTITGNFGNNVLAGYGGNDTLYGAEGHDALYGHEGFDVLFGGPGNDTIDGGADADRLYGDIGKDRLFGQEGNDSLYGGTGNDSMYGGDGNDILYGDMGNDRMYGGNGNDKLYSGLGNNTLAGGAGRDTLYGSYNRDVLKGEDGNDRLYGDGGSDTLSGGKGKDILSGGKDNDVFLFDTRLNGRTNVDRITDFNATQDAIWLKASIFAGIGAKGQLSADAFWIGSGAHSASDRIIYDRDHGTLLFDRDGTGGAAPVKFAVIGNVGIDHTDFWIV